MSSHKIADIIIAPYMINTWNAINDPIGIKDIQSRLIYVNSAYRELNGLPKDLKIDGQFDDELPTPLAEFADKLRGCDKLVMNTQERKSALEIHEFGRNKIYSAFICDKFPFLNNDGQVIGTIFHAKTAQSIPSDIFSETNQKTGSIMLYSPSNFFTNAEWLVVFLLKRRFSRKEIASALELSVNTVSNRIAGIYAKTGVTTPAQLTDFIRANSWHNYVPEKFLRMGHSAL